MKVCIVEGCADIGSRRGWCNKHYSRWHRYGSPTGGPPPKERAPCGTMRGYQSHIRRAEEPCEPCREANREYMQAYRQSNPEARQKERDASAARSRAVWRLATEYPERFRELVNDEVGK